MVAPGQSFLRFTAMYHCCILLLVATFVSAQYPPEFVTQVQTYPNIMYDRDKCLPIKGNYEHPQTYICDPNRLLTVATVNRLNTMLAELRDKSSEGTCNPNNPRPIIGIALVNKLKVGNENPDRLLSYAALFSYYLYKNWALPSLCNNEADKMIIFYSKDDGALYTFAGRLLNKKLPTSQIIDIAVQARLPFSIGIYDGLAFLIQRYREAILSDKTDIFGRV